MVGPERRCKTCGLLLSSEERFCTTCGTPSEETRQGNSARARRRLVVISITALCVALAGALVLTLRGGSAPSDLATTPGAAESATTPGPSDLATTPGTYIGYFDDEEGERFAFAVELPGSGQGQVGKIDFIAPPPECTGTWRMISGGSGVWDFEQSGCGADYKVRARARGDKYELTIPGDPRFHGELEVYED